MPIETKQRPPRFDAAFKAQFATHELHIFMADGETEPAAFLFLGARACLGESLKRLSDLALGTGRLGKPAERCPSME